MRLFIGLGLSQGARDALWSAVSGMQVQGQFTAEENYHITMAFLGERNEQQARALHEIIAAAAGQFPPLPLAVNGLGYFGRRENALLHAKLAPSAPLAALSDTLRRLLTGAGETFDAKPFVAHITLARKVNLTGIGVPAPLTPIPFTADRVTLYHSTRVQGELRYLPIDHVGFSAVQE